MVLTDSLRIPANLLQAIGQRADSDLYQASILLGKISRSPGSPEGMHVFKRKFSRNVSTTTFADFGKNIASALNASLSPHRKLFTEDFLRSVVAFVFLLVGLLFTAALAFSVGRVGGLRWIVLLRRRHGAPGILFVMHCLRRRLRRLFFLCKRRCGLLGLLLLVFLPIRGLRGVLRFGS